MYRKGLEEANLGVCKMMGYVEMDPSGRYGRFREVLGKGAMKTVYKAFDEVLGMEVAWYQVKLNQVFQSPEELQRLYSEVHLLKNLKHQSLIKFYTSWIHPDQRTFNFITEMFTSGTLREYRQRYKRVDMRAIKNWARRILEGLSYLHSHDPPVIHRDLKCDNIFVNGHLGEVKIGDLGLAAILRGSQHAHSVIGTPEFMAPELYEEDYDELVDVYSFGMCMLEMLTSEYPYGECSNPAQIYKKVTTGKLPQAFYRIQDVEARQFVAKCLAVASERPSAVELLEDPFLAWNDERNVLRFPMNESSFPNEIEKENVMPLQKVAQRNTEMTITGTMDPTDDTIFLKVQISDKKGQGKNVYFPFDIKSDTAIKVATEMVKELEMNEWRPSEIAEMIDDEISALIPNWKDNHGQHIFKYDEEEDDDDDNDENKTCNNPFYSHSSSSSFYASSDDAKFQPKSNMLKGNSHHWLQGEDLLDEDDEEDDNSSQSSLNYWSGCENDYEQYRTCPKKQQQQQQQQHTRFGPNLVEVRRTSNGICSENYNSVLNNARAHGMMNDERKTMSRIKSLVDIRSQLLHRSLVEEITKRRTCNTVGAVEGIGFKDPSDY